MKMPRGLGLFLGGLAIVYGNGVAGLAADSHFAGYLLDRSCADNMKAQGMVPDQSHKRECALNESCSRDGYAIYSKGQWYQLDKNGNDLARHMLQETKTPEGHFVSVAGTLEKGQIKVSSLKELAKQQ